MIGIAIVALAWRAFWLRSPLALTPDGIEYLTLARGLLTSRFFTMDGVTASHYRPPLYPLMIAAVGRGSGLSLDSATTTASLWPIFAAQAILGTVSAVLVYLIAFRLFGRRVAVLAGLGLALAPTAARFSSVLLTETLFTCLVVAAVWAWVCRRGGSAGFLFGLATLARVMLWPFLAVLGLGSFFLPTTLRRTSWMLCACGALVLAPWIVRNAVFSHTVTIASGGWGTTLYDGTIRLHRGTNPWSLLVPSGESPVDLDEGERNAWIQAIRVIRTDPAAWIAARLSQWPHLFVDAGNWIPLALNTSAFDAALSRGQWLTVSFKAAFTIGNTLVAFAALGGFLATRRRWIELVPLWSVPVYFCAAHLPVYVEPRYGLALQPFLLIYAAVLVDRIVVVRSSDDSSGRQS
ncbi:MAG TPA: hypothetical protein VH583_24060 [Vicinamibacterales bacterium]